MPGNESTGHPSLELLLVEVAIDRDLPHRLGRGGEAVPSAVPTEDVRPDEPEIGIVHRVGVPEGSARYFAAQPPGAGMLSSS
mgnify:CR=1 FL=1